MNYKKTKLKNGLTVITIPMQDTQTATVVIMVGVGSRYETEKEAGLSHSLTSWRPSPVGGVLKWMKLTEWPLRRRASVVHNP